MTERSRRGFLRNASLGAGVVAAAALVPQGSAEAVTDVSTGAQARGGPVPGGPVMAYVSDPFTGEISLFVGTEEFIYRDRDLATRLARAVQHVRPA